MNLWESKLATPEAVAGIYNQPDKEPKNLKIRSRTSHLLLSFPFIGTISKKPLGYLSRSHTAALMRCCKI